MLGESKAFSGFSVDDTATARAFYEGVLGLEVSDEGMGGLIGLHLATGAVVLVYPKGDAHQPASFTVLNFPVDDIEAAVNGLAERGVSVRALPARSGAPTSAASTAAGDVGGPDIAWFTDPAGNILAVMADPV